MDERREFTCGMLDVLLKDLVFLHGRPFETFLKDVCVYKEAHHILKSQILV